MKLPSSSCKLRMSFEMDIFEKALCVGKMLYLPVLILETFPGAGPGSSVGRALDSVW